MDFLNLPERNTILFTLNPTGVLTPLHAFPEGFKNKISYLIKLEHVEITSTNYDSILLCGDVSMNPIEDLKAFTENVSDYNTYLVDLNTFHIFINIFNTFYFK